MKPLNQKNGQDPKTKKYFALLTQIQQWHQKLIFLGTS